jgi:hypothetical protein
MKRTLATLSGLSVLSAASLAFAFPGPHLSPVQRVRQDAQVISQNTHSIAVRSERAGRHRWGFGQRRAAIAALRELGKAATELVVKMGPSPKRLFSAYKKIEARFVKAQRLFPWLSPSPASQAELAQVANAVADIGIVLRQMASATPPFPMPPPRPVIVPPVPPKAPPAPATMVWTAPGTSVTWQPLR